MSVSTCRKGWLHYPYKSVALSLRAPLDFISMSLWFKGEIYFPKVFCRLRAEKEKMNPDRLNELRHWSGGLPQWVTFSLSNDHIWFPELH